MYKKIIIGIICVVLLSGAALGGRYLYQTWKYKKIISEIVIANPDLSKLKDGVYNGSFDAILVAVDVSVTIENKKIKEIKIDRHKNERGSKALNIISKVVSAQSLEVDTVSGATNSSKVILKAIENALDSGN
ncbi:MAG: FMN-binding protein [Clostridia bacterium]|nr:FMN-binding protein [Clostridia bacterium]